MKKTKRILALMLVLAMSVCAFAACSKDEKKEEKPASTNTTSVEPTLPEVPVVPTVDPDEEAVADYVEAHKAELISELSEFGEASVAADGTRIKITLNMTSLEAEYSSLSSEDKASVKELMATELSSMESEFKAEFGDGINAELPELTGMDIIFTIGSDVLYTLNVDL